MEGAGGMMVDFVIPMLLFAVFVAMGVSIGGGLYSKDAGVPALAGGFLSGAAGDGPGERGIHGMRTEKRKMAKAKTAKIEYLISYELDAKDGKERAYKSLHAALKRMGAKPFMKSQWRYGCAQEKTAESVAEELASYLRVELASKATKAPGSVEKVPPFLKLKDDKLLVSPFFPPNSRRIFAVDGLGRQELL